MNILLNSYPVGFDCPGGGEIQLLKTSEYLEKFGNNVFFFNQWEPQFRDS